MAWYNSAKDFGKSLKSAGGAVFGNREDSGILGTGQFRSKEYEVKDKAFDSAATAQNRGEFGRALKGVQGRAAPKMDTAQADQFRNRQTAQADRLQAQVEGRGGPSVAEMQMQRGLNQGLANANSMAASSRGVSPAMAMRLAQQNQANMSQDATGQGAILRAQEQQAAEQQLGQLSGQARGQDLDTAQNNMSSQLSQRQANDAQERFYREGQMTMDERQRQAAIERERMKSQNSLGYNQVNSGAYQAAAQNRAGSVGGIAQGIAGAIAMSDEKAKMGIQKVEFVSPANSTFQPALPVPSAPVATDTFEPTIEAADSKKKEDTQKYLKEMNSKPSTSSHEAMGKGMAQLGAALMSDENSKKGAVDGQKNSKGFLDALQAYTYKYKNPANGEGQQLGVMAQDLEKTPIGKTMVIDTPEGKMVDYGKAGGVMMANQAMLNDRLGQLEKAFTVRKKQRSA